MATTAVAENQRAAASLGLSPDRIATANWALGSALARCAGILIAPIIQLQVSIDDQPGAGRDGRGAHRRLPLLPGRPRRRSRVGRRREPADRYVTTSGVNKSLPFIVIVVWMILRGQALPLRDYFLQRLPGRRQRQGATGRHRRRGRWSPAFADHCRSRRDGRTRSSARSRWPSCCCRSWSSPATPGSCRWPSSRWPGSARSRRPAGRRSRAGRSCSALLAGVAGTGRARRAVRPPGRAVTRHQPGHRDAGPRDRARADDLPQRRLRRWLLRHGRRQARPVRLGHQRHHAPGPLRHRGDVRLHAGRR